MKILSSESNQQQPLPSNSVSKIIGQVKRRTTIMLTLLSSILFFSRAVNALGGGETMMSGCSQISLMPGEIFITYAKDISFQQLATQDQSSFLTEDSKASDLPEPEGLVDIHSFNSYFTFQIDRHLTSRQVEVEEPPSMQTTFLAPKSSGGEGFIFKLKVELSSAFSDQVQQGMRVTLIDASKGSYSILVDASSLDNDLGSVYLEYPGIKDGGEYVVRYDLYDKEIVANSEELGSLSSSGTQVLCKLPFVTQELLIIDKRLAKHRISEHNRNVEQGSGRTTDISESGIQCNFSALNNTEDQKYGEDGLFCETQLLSYQTKSSSASKYSKMMRDRQAQEKRYRVIYEHEFDVRGSEDEPITYWYEMLVGINFLTSSSLKVMLTRNDKQFEKEDPFSCMYDKSCVLATMSQKNQLRLDLILTTGRFKLLFLDEESKEMNKFINQEAAISQRPFTFGLRSFPVLQNENRVNCPFMFMEKDFLQQRFIEGKRGRKFIFADKIIMNIFNLTSQFEINPEEDMVLKARVKEAYGVNTEMALCERPENCLTTSTQIGTSEILIGEVQKGQSYYVELSFTKSIIQLSEFFTCPHIELEITMISTKEANSLYKTLKQSPKTSDLENQEALASVFNNITSGDAENGFAFIDHQQIFTFSVDKMSEDEEVQNFEVTTVKFVVYEKAQMYLEIFYEPYFQDLELTLISPDATNVKAHLKVSTEEESTPVKMGKVDWSLFKGSKKVFVELEIGVYDIKITQKVPSVSSSSPLFKFLPDTVSFQLYLLFAKRIEKQQILPPSLNYFGMLGPSGSNFGEFTFSCSDCLLENTRYKIIDFKLELAVDQLKTGKRSKVHESLDANFNAEISSDSNDVEVKFEVDDLGDDVNGKKYYGAYDVVFDDVAKKGYAAGSKLRIFKAQSEQAEESITADSLTSNTLYRIVILNTGDKQSVSFNLRLEILENPQSVFAASPKGQKSLLPKSIDEVMRYKLKSPGVKESEFIIGNRFMMKWMDEDQLHPFLRKSDAVYQTAYKDQATGLPFLLKLPFEVLEEQSQVYVSLFDYSGLAGVGAVIMMADDPDSTWQLTSTPAKYHSFIEPTTLTRGSYILAVTPLTEFELDSPSHMIRFSVDFLYEKESSSDIMQQFILNSMEMCSIPSLPRSVSPKDSPSYNHALSGLSMNHHFQVAISDIYTSDALQFDLPKPSLVTVYLETPKDLETEIQILSANGNYRRKASSQDLNKDVDNFLKQTQFQHANIVQLRDYASEGSYKLRILTTDLEAQSAFSMMPRCQAAILHFSIEPLPQLVASKSFPLAAPLSSVCSKVSHMGQKLKFGEYIHGSIIQSQGQQIFDTSYISLDEQGEGPFYLYMQTQYEQTAEGVLSMALYKHNKESQTFTEVASFVTHDHSSYLMTVVEEGVYVLGLSSISATESKYTVSKSFPSQSLLLKNPCLNISFSYYVTSALDHDSQKLDFDSFGDFLSSLIFGISMDQGLLTKLQTARDQTMRDQFGGGLATKECRFEETPRRLEPTESGYDTTYSLGFSRKASQTIDIIVQEDSVLKVMIGTENSKNSVNAFIYKNSDMKDLLAYTKPSVFQKEVYILLKSQKKAYSLKLVEDSIDETDQCPIFTLRIALKPIKLVKSENLKCSGLGMPPSLFKLEGSSSAIDGSYQVSSDFISQYQKRGPSAVSFDLKLDVADAKKDYYFDVETKYDFITTDLHLQLLAVPLDKDLYPIPIGESIWYQEELQDSSQVDESSSNLANIVKRLKVTNIWDEVDPTSIALSSTYILRLKFSKQMASLIKDLQPPNPLCFSFDLSVRVSDSQSNATKSPLDSENSYLPQTDPTKNELVRIDWSTKQSLQLFDPRQKLSVFLQFKESMREEYKTLKFQPFAYLTLDEKATPQQKDKLTMPIKIYPETVRLSTVDKSSLVLTFLHNTLQRGACYKLVVDSQQLGVKYDEKALAAQNKLCTTHCQCNPKGMKSCDETTATCLCHSPFTGSDCAQCEKGFAFNQETSECEPLKKCKETGGEEDCNQHGECFEDELTGQAKCICRRGFADDGLDLCSKCSDPLFTYPNCDTRNWVVEESNYECEKLETTLPVYLYNSSQSAGQKKFYQNQDGFAFWSGTYKVNQPVHKQQSKQNYLRTLHYFQVSSNSVVRLFMDTHNSGLNVNFRVLDDQMRVVASSLLGDEQGRTDMLFQVVKQSSTFKQKQREPYTLELEFYFSKLESYQNQCHMLEISFIVQPFDRMSNYLQCSSDEIQSYKSQQLQSAFLFGSQSHFSTYHVTLSSSAYQASPQDLPKVIAIRNDQQASFMTLSFEVSVGQSGGALSFISKYSFEKMVTQMNLKDKLTGTVVATEIFSSLEDFEVEGQLATDMVDDMISFIEIPQVEKGEYILEILIARGLFLTKSVKQESQSPNCLSFDLSVEFVPRRAFDQDQQQDQRLDVVAVVPYASKRLKSGKKLSIQLKLASSQLAIDSDENFGLKEFVHLQAIDDEDTKIKAQKVLAKEKDSLQVIVEMYHSRLLESNNEVCFKLVLNESKFKPLDIQTMYCVEPTVQEDELKCNPNSLFKIVENKCVCTYPYKGALCDDCAQGYVPVLDQSTQRNACALDLTKCSQDICNSHGQCSQLSHSGSLTDFKCECSDKYVGNYCEKCKDPVLAYPDCESQNADLYAVDFQKEQSERQSSQYQNKDQGYSNKVVEIKKKIKAISKGFYKQQCQMTTYPQDLDRVEFMQELASGETHIADFYTINHDADNLIKFTPRQQGTIKILVQAPELEEKTVNDETFDIEIAIWDSEKDKFILSAVNKEMDFQDNSHLLNGKQDDATLQMQIPFESVNKTLFLVFRAVNYTLKSLSRNPLLDSSKSLQKTSAAVAETNEAEFLSECESAYIEIQYTVNTHPCQNNQNLKFNAEGAIKVDSSYKSFGAGEVGAAALQSPFYSLSDSYSSFFWYQDFYLGSQSSDGAKGDFELKVSIHQKFVEENMIDFVVELLEEGVPYDQIDFRKYQTRASKPDCELLCEAGGQKAFNEIHNVFTISGQSLARVWLHQSARDGQCANYQLFLEASAVKPSSSQLKSQEELRCEELDLPRTLNTHRYLGAPENSEQNDFHYLERFRVDNLPDNSAHAIEFTLTEPSLLRVLTTVHKHIEFDIVLKQVSSKQDGERTSSKLIDSRAKNYEDSIFAQLDKGTYELQVLFLSEAFYMQQPCQSIQMEVGVTKISSAKRALANSKDSRAATEGTSTFDIQALLSSKQSLRVHPAQTLATYSFSDKELIRKYQSYIELSNQKFSIPKVRDLGVIITVRSDYMLNNVNFALSNVNNQRLLANNHRRENFIQLVAKNIPGGDYELLIYAHNCLSNIVDESQVIREIGIWFEVEVQFVKWVEQDDFIQHYLYVDAANKTLKSEIETLHVDQFQCYQEALPLRTLVKPLLEHGDKVDDNYLAMLPVAQGTFYQHVMEYTPANDQNALRVIVDYFDARIKLVRNIADSIPIAESYAVSSGEQQLLLAQGLQSEEKVYLVLEFSASSRDTSLGVQQVSTLSQICNKFRIQIESFSSKKACSKQSLKEDETPVSINGKIDTMLLLQSKRVKSSRQIAITSQTPVELWVTVEFAQNLYLPTIQLSQAKAHKAGENSRNQKFTRGVLEFQPHEVYSEIQEMMIYKFRNLNSGEYFLNVSQFGKPKDCLSIIPIRLRAQPMNSGLYLDQVKYGMVKTYMSEEEIQILNRFVQPLPITLDTYKYLIDEDYMLISEYVQLSSQEDNRIFFKVRNRDDQKSFFRLYVENSDILISLKTKAKDIKRDEVHSLTERLSNGEYFLTLDYSTKLAQQKATLSKSAVHLTILVVSEAYLSKNYVSFQGEALKDCRQNTNFPLALSKNKNLQYNPNEIVFDYQLLRLSDKLLADNLMLDDYKFRINETSRFYFTLGMHAAAHQVLLRVSELSGYGNQRIGKQEFNLNVLDVVLSPGDYKVSVEQPTIQSWTDTEGLDLNSVCGVFSFHGRVSPISNYAGLDSKRRKQIPSKCEIKQVLPSQIYQSEAKTKDGLEPHVNSDGSFNQVYQSILIRKHRNSQSNPEFDRVQLTAPEFGVLSILLQYPSKRNEVLVKLFDSFSFSQVPQEPISSFESEAARGLTEVNFLFKVEKQREYYLMVYYKGEPTLNPNTGDEVCEYMNAFISIATVTHLEEEFSCVEQSVKIPQLVKDLPERITDKNLDSNNQSYSYSDFTQIRYPSDYQEGEMFRVVEVKLSKQSTIDAKIKFDYPFALFDLSLADNMLSDETNLNTPAENYQTVVEQLPLQYSNQDSQVFKDGDDIPDQSLIEVGDFGLNPTLQRQLRGRLPLENNVYYLILQDKVSYQLLNYVYTQMTNKQELCLYTKVDLKIQAKSKQSSQLSLSSQAPRILGIAPSANPQNPYAPYLLSNDQNLLVFTIEFSTAPFMKSQAKGLQNKKSASKNQMADVVNLQVLNHQSKQLLYSKKPVKISLSGQNDKNGNSDSGRLSMSFYFDVAAENEPQKPQTILRPSISLEQLVDSQERPFLYSTEMTLKAGSALMPLFTQESKIDVKQKKNNMERSGADGRDAAGRSEIDQYKRKISGKDDKTKDLNEQKKKQQKVECLCVHGKCRDGEAYCYKCDQGWTGKLCDLPLSENGEITKNHNERSDGQIIQRNGKKQVKRDGSRLARDRDQDREDALKLTTNESGRDNKNQKARKKNENQRQSSADSDMIRDYELQQIINMQRKESDMLLTQKQQKQGDDGSLITEDVLLTVGVLLTIAGLVYALVQKSKIKGYIPLPVNEKDDEGRADKSQLELTEFSRRDEEQHSQLRQRRQQKHQQNQQQLQATSSKPSKEQPKTGDHKIVKRDQKDTGYPSDIVTQLRQKDREREQRQLLTRREEEQFQMETSKLTSELELYANDHDEEQVSLSSSSVMSQRHWSSFPVQDVMEHSRNWADVQAFDQSGENHFSGASDQQPQYYNSSQTQQEPDYNPFNSFEVDEGVHLAAGDGQELAAATSDEIDNVLREMQQLEAEDQQRENTEEDSDEESSKLF